MTDFLDSTPLFIGTDVDFMNDAALRCFTAQALPRFCPAGVYRLDRQGQVMVGSQACLECGSCRVGCPFLSIRWALPRGGYGVAYKLG